MSTLTDPARELVEICEALREQTNVQGDAFLAKRFGVPGWSTEFFQIIFQISKRIDDLAQIVSCLEIDDDFRNEAVSHVRTIQQAFGQDGLRNHWSHASTHFLAPQHVNPLKYISTQVREQNSYPKLTDEEIAEIVGLVVELSSWLKDHQLEDHDFIRQTIIEGIDQFRFRIERLRWLGWGYSLQSLREVIGAYMALERAVPDLQSAPITGAVLQKTAALVREVFLKAKLAKDVRDTSKFALEVYGATTLLIQGKQTVAGLLSFTGVGP